MPVILLDKPYVSSFLKNTLGRYQFPVVTTPAATPFLEPQIPTIGEDEAIARARAAAHPRLYTNSENAIGWIAQNLGFSDLPDKIDLFKNKLRFRQLLQEEYPHFYFRGISDTGLNTLDIASVPVPFIIKPAVGFFSMGVYQVSAPEDWPQTLAAIHAEIEMVRHLYPPQVMDASQFIIEEMIPGDEYAIDAWFDEEGQPHIVGIYKHLFSSEADTSDRVYVTSRHIIETNLPRFTDFLTTIGRLADVRNFPLHAELRLSPEGVLQPIEINPMRFGGWCTTADMTARSFGLNPYQSYLQNQPPNWPELLESKGDEVYAMIVLDNSTGIPGDDIRQFEYDRATLSFDRVLEVRPLDWRTWPVFGFLFVQTDSEDACELRHLLNSDLREFVVRRDATI